MPINEYKCPNCPEHIELFRKASETDPVSCQKCQTDMVKQFPLIGGYAPIKGNGASQRPKGAGSVPKKVNK